ncbi:hypothetical protein [Intrasporangium flavum]|uniref:hypothetical protein n=1 Tax=Intrasporangium flavum TaxID=1428657 RepID=UPI00096CD3CD|nr:hypothetical protein [Intrasporangium flavum]
MARFTSIHPLHFTEPAVRFQPEGDQFVLETDDDAVIDAMRALPADFHVVEHVVDELDQMKKPELEGYATEYGIDLTGCRSNADRVKAIRAHFATLADRDDEPGADDTTPAVLESQPVPAADDNGDTE